MAKRRDSHVHKVSYRQWYAHVRFADRVTACGASPRSIAVDWDRVTCPKCLLLIDRLGAAQHRLRQSLCGTALHENVTAMRKAERHD